MFTDSASAVAQLQAVLVRNRRSIRVFRDDPVPSNLIAELLHDALWAPSPHNSQPWRFTGLFASEEKARLARVMAERLSQELTADGLGSEMITRQTERSYRRISSAPVVILCSLCPDGLRPFDDERRRKLEWQMAVQSVGAVLQTLFLLASARGLGTCWVAAPMYCADIVRATLSLPPEFEPQALVLLGYAAVEGRVRPRRGDAEVIDLR